MLACLHAHVHSHILTLYQANCELFAFLGDKTKARLNAAELFVSGGLAGMISWTCMFPVDVVKSRMQTVRQFAPSFYGN